ncbi:MAG: CobD/CbiB family protein [Burkholderiaceae bacterium]|nr:CobD/CbiB family protein [Burkholderiaceae bacterium]
MIAWLALLSTLLLEQAFALPANNPVHVLATTLSDSTARHMNAGRPRHGVYAWLMFVGGGVLLTGAVYYAARSLHWGAVLALDVAVLYLAFGFRQFSHPLTRIQKALESGDVRAARELLQELKHRADPELRTGDLTPGEIARQAIDIGLIQAHRHVFAVLFWFAVLPGPTGAVLYRLAEFVRRRWNPRLPPGGAPLAADGFGRFAVVAFQVIDWLPARLTALGFAIVGDFEGAVYCWRRISAVVDGELADSQILISGTAGGALGFRVLTESESARIFDEPGQEGAGLAEPDPRAMRSAVGLVWRALVLWMVLLLLLTAATLL